LQDKITATYMINFRSSRRLEKSFQYWARRAV